MERKCPYCGEDDIILEVEIKVGVYEDRYGGIRLLEENLGDVMDCLEEALSKGTRIHAECCNCEKEFDVNMVNGVVEGFIPR